MKFQNTEAIFETIGNYPVVDQFDVLYSNLLSGSTNDNYVSGAMFTKTVNAIGIPKYVAGNRGNAFSKLGVSQNKLPPLNDGQYSYSWEPWRERAGITRLTRIFSDSERFYDSLTPDLKKMVKILGGEIVRYKVQYQVLFSNPPPVFLPNPIVTVENNAIIFDNIGDIQAATNLCPDGFENYFPFEPTFSSVQRTKRAGESFISSKKLTVDFTNAVYFPLLPPLTPPIITIEDITPIRTKTLLLLDINPDSNPTHGADFLNLCIDGYFPFSGSVFPGNWGAKESTTAKVIFGFGDRNTSQPTKTKGKNNLVKHRFFLDVSTIDPTQFYYLSASPIVRGWKYGLIDGNPHYTSCVFRRDRFGQFRDMLEQRLEPVSYLDTANSPTQYLGDFESPATPIPDSPKTKDYKFGSLTSVEGTIEYPVQVSFVKQQIVNKKLIYSPNSPSNTWSSNLNQYATSSLPYFDLDKDSDGRNRPPIPDSLLNSTIFLV